MGKKPEALGGRRETGRARSPQQPKPEDVYAPSHNLDPLIWLGLSLFSFKGGGNWSAAQAVPCWTKAQEPEPEDKGGLLGRQEGAVCPLQCLNGLLSLLHVELSDPPPLCSGMDQGRGRVDVMDTQESRESCRVEKELERRKDPVGDYRTLKYYRWQRQIRPF